MNLNLNSNLNPKQITARRQLRLHELLNKQMLTSDEISEKKRIERLEKNRKAAAMSREKKKKYIKELQEKTKIFEKRCSMLEIENYHLRSMLHQYQFQQQYQFANNFKIQKNIDIDIDIDNNVHIQPLPHYIPPPPPMHFPMHFDNSANIGVYCSASSASSANSASSAHSTKIKSQFGTINDTDIYGTETMSENDDLPPLQIPIFNYESDDFNQMTPKPLSIENDIEMFE